MKAVYPNPIQRPKSSPVLQQNQDIKPAVVTQHPSPNLKISPAQVKKVKTSTIADKLKLSLAKSPNKPTPAPQKKKEEKPVTPRIVVKEIPAPTKNNKEAAKIINKTNSIMVTKLWRGLKKEDILEYFGTFGKVIAASMTDSGNEMVDGYKYLFLKFADAKAVDKVLGKLLPT